MKIVEEKPAEKLTWQQRRIAVVIEELQDGGNLIIETYSQLGRSLLECMSILATALQRGIQVYASKCHWQLNDPHLSQSVAMAFAMVADIERDLISQRTQEALRAKKAAGQRLGRPKGPGKSKLDPSRTDIETLLANGATKAFIAKRFHTTPANLTSWMKKHDIKRPEKSK